MTGWRARALAELEPTPDEDEAVHASAQALLDAIQSELDERGWEGTPRVEGSLAKGTYLHGEADADVFVQFPTTVDRDEMVRRVNELKAILDDAVVAYAEHPYAQGTWEAQGTGETLDAEIVPCYDLDDPRELRSAVDRTPFHTEYVVEHLTDELREDVRLLKAFLAAAGCYGAEERYRGVSGYLAELLVLSQGSFEDVLSWAVHGCPHPITLEGPAEGSFEAPLVVVDPVDPARNAAAAVAEPVLVRLREAAAAFRAEPSADLFHAPPPAELGAEEALERTRRRGSRVLALGVPVADAELDDPLFAQLRRAVTLAAEEIEREQIPVLASRIHLHPDDEPETGWILVEASAAALEAPYLHRGPPVDVGDHADRFREAWAGDPSAVGDVFEEDGRLFVRVERGEETLADVAEPHLRDAKAGKVVDEALDEGTARVIEGKEAIAGLPGRARGELLDRRRPWERWPSPTDAGAGADGWA